MSILLIDYILCFIKIKFKISCQIVEVCKYDLRMFLAPGAASLPALVRFVGPGVQWQSAARLWGLGVLLLFSLVVGSAHKYQSDQYLPFVSQAKLEVFLLTRHLASVTTAKGSAL